MPADAPTLLIGATSGTGAAAARQLLDAGGAVRVLARDPARACETIGEGASEGRAEIVGGDVTVPETLMAAVQGVAGLIYTAGIRDFFAEARSRAVVVEGARHALDAARAAGTVQRFVFMSSIGVARPSMFGALLDRFKGGALRHKAEAERLVRASGLPYTIVRAGVLTNRGAGTRPVLLGQDELPLRADLLIARRDAARVLTRCLVEPRALDTTFDAFWGRNGDSDMDFSELAPDRDLSGFSPDGRS